MFWRVINGYPFRLILQSSAGICFGFGITRRIRLRQHFLPPYLGLLVILHHTATVSVHHAQIVLRHSITLLCQRLQ